MKKDSFAFLALVMLVAGVGSYVGGKASSRPVTPIELHANSAPKANNVSMATGVIDNDFGGLYIGCLYILDHDTGDLNCWSIDPRTGEVNGTFKTNVAADMQTDKAGNPNYLLLTSYFFPAKERAAFEKFGVSTCFVADTDSGKIIGYKAVFDKKTMFAGRLQNGVMKPVFKSLFRGN